MYFCDPYKSYQKASIENGNRLLRETLKKSYKIDGLEQQEINVIAGKLNNRPLKVLNFMTPKEGFLQECQYDAVVPNFAVRA